MDYSTYFRFVAVLLFVLGLIGVCAILAKRFIPGARNINVRRGKQRRLSIVETIPVDTKRRLVLIKRDDTEHLVMIGPQGDSVIERNIGTHFVDMIETDEAPKYDGPEQTSQLLGADQSNNRNTNS